MIGLNNVSVPTTCQSQGVRWDPVVAEDRDAFLEILAYWESQAGRKHKSLVQPVISAVKGTG